MSAKKFIMHIDGACRGNPGPAAVGILIKENGTTVKEIAKAIGEATNNIAEYSALIYALQEALVLKADEVKIFTDSELLFNQVAGNYKVKDQKLKWLFEQVAHLMTGFKKFSIAHVPREENKDADRLASSLLKLKQTKVVAPLFEYSEEESPSSKG